MRHSSKGCLYLGTLQNGLISEEQILNDLWSNQPFPPPPALVSGKYVAIFPEIYDQNIWGPIFESGWDCADWTDVNLADKDVNSNQTDNANKAIQDNLAMQVTQPCDNICNLCKQRHLMTDIWTNPSGAAWWPNLHFMERTQFGGQILTKYKFVCSWL